MVEHPEAVTEILNNQDILRGVIHCIGEEKMAVAKQVNDGSAGILPITHCIMNL